VSETRVAGRGSVIQTCVGWDEASRLVASFALANTAVRAQQVGTTRRIGVLLGLSKGPDDPGAGEILRPLTMAMEAMGWVGGRNVLIDVRYGAGDRTSIDVAADELVTLNPDLIYVTGLPPAQALRKRTSSIPIVFSFVADPVGFGLIDSLGRPGGNVTGFVVWDLSIGGKWIQLLLEAAPNLRRVGVMYNPDTGPYAPALIDSAKVSATKGVAVIECHTRNEGEVESAVAQLGNGSNGGLIVIPEPFTNANRDKIIALCNRYKIPTLNPVFGAATRGALVSYTYAFDEMIRQSATYVDRVLRGESPRDLPVQAPIRYELSINLGVAKSLGLTVPANLVALADHVIE
jgi:putative tryptophan/tyrosine transport system substrate-binding protein